MKSYKFPKRVSIFLQIVAVFELVIGLAYSATIVSDMFPFFSSLFYTIVYFLVLMSLSSIIQLLINITENSQNVADNVYIIAKKNDETI